MIEKIALKLVVALGVLFFLSLVIFMTGVISDPVVSYILIALLFGFLLSLFIWSKCQPPIKSLRSYKGLRRDAALRQGQDPDAEWAKERSFENKMLKDEMRVLNMFRNLLFYFSIMMVVLGVTGVLGWAWGMWVVAVFGYLAWSTVPS
jgi:hypothetical protein